MISTNSRTTDKDDVAVLFYSMCVYGELNEDHTDRSLVSVGFGEMLSRAERAAEVIAECHGDEGDDWDGVLWLEVLENADEGSLAGLLFMLDDEDMVPTTTMEWLQNI